MGRDGKLGLGVFTKDLDVVRMGLSVVVNNVLGVSGDETD